MIEASKARCKRVAGNVSEFVVMAFVTLMTLISTLRLLGILS